MNKTSAFFLSMIIAGTMVSCGSGDHFVGKWIVCDHPEGNVMITKSGDSYNLHISVKTQSFDVKAEKKSEDVASGIGPDGVNFILRYDKPTNHLMMTHVVHHEEKTEQWCR